jgi:hypothetical protein
MAEKIQPTLLPGRCATITAPTTMNAVKASSRAAGWAGFCWNSPLAAIRGIPTPTPATKIASMDQAIQVERLRTMPPRPMESHNPPSAR